MAMKLLTLRKEAKRRADMLNDEMSVRELCEKGAIDVVCKDEWRKSPLNKLRLILMTAISDELINEIPSAWNTSCDLIHGMVSIRFVIIFRYSDAFLSGKLERIAYRRMLEKFIEEGMDGDRIMSEMLAISVCGMKKKQ